MHKQLNFHIKLLKVEFFSIQSHYKESWRKIRDGGYKLRLDAIPFQAAKSSAEILSDVSILYTIDELSLFWLSVCLTV